MTTRTMTTIAALGAACTLISGTTASAFASTKSDPTPIGTYDRVGGDWKAKVISVDRNANAEVAAENEFNDPPRTGYQYVMVKVRGKKVSSGKGNLFWDVDFNLFGKRSKHLYDYAWEVIPNDLSDQDDVLKGGVVTGNILFEVSKSDIKAGGMKLRAESFLDKPIAWYRLAG